MTHGSLFSGIGGFDLAAQWAGIPTLWQCEIDPFCQKVLRKNFPETKIYADIKETDWTKVERPDIISAGFPCQPFSVAGKRKGEADARYLWPQLLQAISILLPDWFIGENVSGFISMGFDTLLADLESLGYEVRPVIIPAAGLGAPHTRDRAWFLAHRDAPYPNAQRGQKQHWVKSIKPPHDTPGDCDRIPAGWHSHWTQAATRLCRVDDGIPGTVDRHKRKRLKALGNAIVPQIAYQLFNAIKVTLLNS